MASGFAIAVIIGIIILIWLLFEVKRARHKMFAIFLIALILFSYFSFTYVIRDKDVNLKSFSGMAEAGKLYFSWLGSLFGNFKEITANAIKMDWKGKDVDKKNSTRYVS